VSARVYEDVNGRVDADFEDMGEQQLKNIARPVRVYCLDLTRTKNIGFELNIEDGFVTPRLSILVLPFANLSNDPDQNYFADGLTDDLTTDLAQWTNSFVIACRTALRYKGKALDTRQIRRKANNLQQSWRFDWEPRKAVLRDVRMIDWILGR
jgi:hypothetical protein